MDIKIKRYLTQKVLTSVSLRRVGRASSEGPSTTNISTTNGTVQRKKSSAMYFLPTNNESPVMLIKKHPHESGRKDSFDSGIGMQVCYAIRVIMLGWVGWADYFLCTRFKIDKNDSSYA